MKKLILSVTLLLAVIIVNAQSLEDIIGKYTVANKLDKISNFKTIKISAKTSVMGMDMPMEMWMKNPNKFKSVTSFNGQDIVQVFDGEKGYMVNPMAGSTDPVEMTSDQVESRTSSPVRVPRDPQTLAHPQFENLYPCGEGAGYAGGIVSAAIDGQRVAQALAQHPIFASPSS